MLAHQTTRRRDGHHEVRVQRIPTHWLLRELERRGVPAPRATPPLVRLPGLEVNRAWRTATWGTRVAKLTTREVDVLLALAESYPEPVSGPALGAAVWTTNDPPEAEQSARTYVHYLRRKLPGLIVTGWAGYSLALEATP